MNGLPGFTAEQCLTQYRLHYGLQWRSGESQSTVRPQFIRDIICESLLRCCIDQPPGSGCCGAYGSLCTLM